MRTPVHKKFVFPPLKKGGQAGFSNARTHKSPSIPLFQRGKSLGAGENRRSIVGHAALHWSVRFIFSFALAAISLHPAPSVAAIKWPAQFSGAGNLTATALKVRTKDNGPGKDPTIEIFVAGTFSGSQTIVTSKGAVSLNAPACAKCSGGGLDIFVA